MKERIHFGYLPEEYSDPENAEIVIVPVAYDGTSTWIKGADKGPAAMIEASVNMELYDIETDSEVYKKGIFTEETTGGDITTNEMIDAVHGIARYYLENNKFVVVIGGEHSVSIGSIKAHARHFENLTVLQLDAHTDLREEYNGSRNNHACVMARTKELCPIVQVGIRSMDSSEKEAMDKASVFFAKDIYNKTDWIKNVISKLSENVYITIDLDVFDPSIMPSTGTPEPGGLLWYDVLELLKTVSDKKNLVGFDVVELCPNSRNTAPDFMAAKLIYKLLSYKFRK
ncbi:MAG: agmatinase [Planctomycetes bacterium]|nr:agmatinase [Planctomycetota bacterium]MBL7146473.1 agmatinase [Phycisphaerae bacterium]